MYRIIIVDDEPLILAGISSLLNWEDYECTIIGKATNGPSAYEMIIEQQPDIIITDIRMPVMDGLELVRKCKQADCQFAFIVLTNLEEFHLARQALALGASEYLVKLNLTPEELSSALEKAKQTCNMLLHAESASASHTVLSPSEQLKACLHRHLILQESDVVMPNQLAPMYSRMVLIKFSIRHTSIAFLPEEAASSIKQVSSQITDILNGICARFFETAVILPEKSNAFLLAAVLKKTPSEEPGAFSRYFQESLLTFCSRCNSALKTYFEMTAVFGISSVAEDASRLRECASQAATALEYYYYDSSSPVVFYQGQTIHKSNSQNFNINFLKKDMSVSIQQNDSEKLSSIFGQIIELFTECKPCREHAASACINIYTYLYSYFDTQDNIYRDIFPYTINIAEYLNQFTSLADILEWLQSFCRKLCRLLEDRRNNPSDKLVEKAQKYIHEHYTEKLTLGKIAEQLNISAGHLSITFSKFTGTTLSDYIASVKIEHAKELIDTHKYLMYEISDMLGFDSPYYFSKVFKKVTGISPREHEKRM